MKKATFTLLLVPVLIFAASLAGPLEQVAHADSAARVSRGGHVGGRDGFVGRGGRHDGQVGRYVGYGGHRHGGRRGHSSFSTSIWFGPGLGLWDPFYYPYYSYRPYQYYAPPTVVIPQQSEEYILPAPQEEETAYWYYCKEKGGYYPYVQRCPTGWMKVVPSPTPPDQDPE